MANFSFKPAKGTRDWYGKETIIRDFIRDNLREVFERYGYDRLETAPIEGRESVEFKGGGEIQKEVFKLTDQGDRGLALRFDQTLPLARYAASGSGITLPFKRYVIGEVFRDGPTQPEQGRYRVFTQCDVDVLGIEDMSAEAELLMLAKDSFNALGLGGIEANINNRKLLDGVLDYANISEESRQKVIISLDKMDKIGVEGVRKDLEGLTFNDSPREISNDTLRGLFDKYDGVKLEAIDNLDLKSKITGEIGSKGYDELKSLFKQKRINESKADLYQTISIFRTKGEKLVTSEQANKILEVVESETDNYATLNNLKKVITSDRGKEGLFEIGQLLDYAKDMKVDFLKFNPALARGLDYYTGTTMEVYLKDKSLVPSAILAGGRFDDMVGDFMGSGEDVPAVGFSFGLERLAVILNNQKEFASTKRQIYIIPIGNTQGESLKIAHELRNQGLRIDMKLQQGGKIKRGIEYAAKQGIPYVVFIGEDELKSGRLKIKDLKEGKEANIFVKDIKNYITSVEK